MGEQLADRDVFLASLRKLGPVGADQLVVVQPAARVGERHDHRREAFCRRVDDGHGVGAPRLAARPVPHAAPQVADLLAIPVDATSGPELTPTGEVLDERIPDGLEPARDRAVDPQFLRLWHAQPPLVRVVPPTSREHQCAGNQQRPDRVDGPSAFPMDPDRALTSRFVSARDWAPPVTSDPCGAPCVWTGRIIDRPSFRAQWWCPASCIAANIALASSGVSRCSRIGR